MNTSSRASVARRGAPAVLLALLLASALAACGGGSPDAAALMSDTFASHEPIESGRIDLSFAVTPAGASASAAQPLGLRVQGPFQSVGPARLPRFALALTLTSAGRTLQAGATSTAGKLYIELAGAYFTAPSSLTQALTESYARATRTSSSAASRSTFAALGLNPQEWLLDPRVAGTVEVAGAPTTHITGALDVSRFLADAERLSGADSALGLGAGAPGLGLLSSGGIGQLASAVRSARMDVYTGTSDHRLRRLSVSAKIASTPQTRSLLGGLSSASLALTLQFAGVGEAQKISAPSNPQPIGKLLPALERLGVALGAGAAG